MSTELMIPEKLDVPAIFAPDGSKDILDSIEREARSVELDISTHDGRRAVASLAYKISRSKTYLDEQGERLVEGWKKSAKAVDTERKRIRDRLDALRDEIRKPLTDFENKEKERIATHENKLQALICPMLIIHRGTDPDEIVNEIIAIDAIFKSRQWDEFTEKATKKRNEVISYLELMLRESTDRIAKEAELIRLQKEESERKQRKRDEQLQCEAAKRARLEAEQEAERKAKAESDRVANELKKKEDEKRAVEQRARKAESDKKAAEAKAKEAVNKERERVEKERLVVEQSAQRKRENLENRAKKHQDILDDMGNCNFSELPIHEMLGLIVGGKIRHVFIKYD